MKSHDPMMMGHNHQVLAWGYDLVGNDLTIFVYDPNSPNDDHVTISLNIGNPFATTAMTYSTGQQLHAFFRPGYVTRRPFNVSDGMIVREVSGAPVYAIVEGTKLWIRSPTELNDYFGGWGAVTTVDDGVVSAIGDVPHDGTVVRETDRPEVKLLDGARIDGSPHLRSCSGLAAGVPFDWFRRNRWRLFLTGRRSTEVGGSTGSALAGWPAAS